MLLLLCHVKKNNYALDAARLIEVVPLVNLKKIPHTPDYVAGLFDYHGTIVPVIDLCTLLHGKPSVKRLGTRIILVDYTGENNTMHILGLIAERVTETIKAAEHEFTHSGIDVEEAPYLGEILNKNQEMVQIVRPHDLIPDDLKKLLFAK